MTATSALTRKDERYKEMFSVEKEVADFGYALVDDIYAPIAALRSKSPVFVGSLARELTGKAEHSMLDRPRYATLTFETCNKVLGDNITYSSSYYREQDFIREGLGHTILGMIGKEHARYRSSIQPMMTREQAMGWWREKWIEPFVSILIDDFQNDGQADLSQQLCARLPMHTVTAAYGLGSEEALAFRESLMASMVPTLAPQPRAEARAKVREILIGAITESRRNPRDDLISRLIGAPFKDAQGNHSQLSDEDILSFSRLLLLAGGGTTYRQMGITLFALLSNRDQMEDLRADRELMRPAIQESLRWNCTDPVFHRISTKPSVLGGVEVPEGALVDIYLAAGNRDPERWDNPDVYDLHRPEKRHIGFASGAHTCLGRFVAEAEMTAAINALLDRFPKLRLDSSGEPPKIIGGLVARGVNHLRVRFD
ncbi:cytochrome P450 [Novosphingobium pentaromativorans]|uniref:Cytochrome P450 n=1 Tax=Novosphingobium pentaromativorans US6-1 TaxID=1088721 RepID=G6EGD6_9SPHN|nr:cytochrome P450 [Novosphingobium pentaromativorans]AIT82186.1 hypothetical protein JI59_21950 [Novosphingobium pentaromativorans US6-1]EHJ59825.1 hypothetical protein NSU_3407 [Novosphingobium pentaromativorans US6-1]